ncbi:MAG: hypothetical protein BWY84_00287 [Candidatus Aerophobetes bacterium ADurb.Bin490]|nr:MAG: hypothetical protein BWY84_00287 [Candidatus Aerophobetes bacterium ADurb.Bin490]
MPNSELMFLISFPLNEIIPDFITAEAAGVTSVPKAEIFTSANPPNSFPVVILSICSCLSLNQASIFLSFSRLIFPLPSTLPPAINPDRFLSCIALVS